MIKTAVDQQARPMNIFGLGTAQNVSYNAAGGANVQSSAFAAKTTAIMITVESGSVRIAIGTNPVATSTSTKILGPGVYVFMADPGGKIAALSNDATPGSISVTEIAAPTGRPQ